MRNYNLLVVLLHFIVLKRIKLKFIKQFLNKIFLKKGTLQNFGKITINKSKGK